LEVNHEKNDRVDKGAGHVRLPGRKVQYKTPETHEGQESKKIIIFDRMEVSYEIHDHVDDRTGSAKLDPDEVLFQGHRTALRADGLLGQAFQID
jgi:hypothetical protein